MEETSFSGAELAARARVGPELIGRLVELGILRGGRGEAPYGLGDVRRVRLVDACQRLGRPQPEDPIHPLDGTCWAAPSWAGCWGWTTGC